MKITEADIRQIYFHCKNNNPEGLYHNKDDELDIIEFGEKIGAYVAYHAAQEAKRDEHIRCVELVRQVNPTVADYLDDKREYPL